MNEKLVILLNLIKKWEKLCKKSLSREKIKKDSYSFGHISGELRAIQEMKNLIDEARKI